MNMTDDNPRHQVQEAVLRDRCKILGVVMLVKGVMGLLVSVFMLFYFGIFALALGIPVLTQTVQHEVDMSHLEELEEQLQEIEELAEMEEEERDRHLEEREEALAEAHEEEALAEARCSQARMGGGILGVLGLFFLLAFLLTFVYHLLILYAGICLLNFRRRVFALVMGCLCLPFVPWGTLIGIGAIVVLTTDEAKKIFDSESPVHDGGMKAET
jgi:hypothetical protein